MSDAGPYRSPAAQTAQTAPGDPLGPLVARYSGSVGTLVFYVVMGLVLCATGVWMGRSVAASDRGDVGLGWLVGVAPVILGALLGWFGIGALRRSLEIRELGLRLRIGRRVKTIRWNELVRLECSRRVDQNARVDQYRLHARAGHIVAFEAGSKITHPLPFMHAREIAQHVADYHLLPSLLASFTAGQRIFLGPVSLDLDGIAHDGRTLAWAELGEPVASRQTVTVESTTGVRIQLDARMLPSLPALEDYGVTALTALIGLGRSRDRKSV